VYTSGERFRAERSPASSTRLWKLGVGLAGFLLACFCASILVLVLSLPGAVGEKPQQTCFAGLKTLPRPSPPTADHPTISKSG
jgi:hypothetical protein